MSRIDYSIDQPFTHDWTIRVGKLMLNFGALEFETYLWFIQLSEDTRATAKLTKIRFSRRVDKIVKYSDERAFSKDWRDLAKLEWGNAKNLTKFRNRIAHSPLVFYEEEDGSTGEPEFIGVLNVQNRDEDPMVSAILMEERISQTAALVTRLTKLRKEWCRSRDNEKKIGT